MHKMVFTLFFTLSIAAAGFAQDLALKWQENGNKGQWLLSYENGQSPNFPSQVVTALEKGYPLAAIAEDKSFLIYQDKNDIHYYSPETGEVNWLMALLPDNEGQSNLAIAGPEAGIYRAIFINVSDKYPDRTRLFVLDIRDGELVDKQKIDIPITTSRGHLPAIPEDFRFGSMHSVNWETRAPKHFDQPGRELDLTFPEFLKITGKKYAPTMVAYGASSFYFELHDANHNKVSLPEEVEAQIWDAGGSVSPDSRYLCYFAWEDDKSFLRCYDFEKEKVTQLIEFYDGGDGIPSVVWYENENRFAFVNINQEKYENGAKIFVITLENGEMASKESFEVPVNFECGSMCLSYPEEDFWWVSEKKIGYKPHWSLELGENAVKYIGLNH